LQLNINRCEPSKESCHNNSVLDAKLSYSFISFGILNNLIDHNNIEVPYSSVLSFYSLNVDPKLNKRYPFYLRQIKYQSDLGYVFQDVKELTFYSYDYSSTEIFLKSTSINQRTNFGIVSIRNSDYVSIYQRSFVKLQALVANFGGLIKVIMIANKILVFFFTRRMPLLELANDFKFSSEEFSEIEKNFNKNNEISDIIGKLNKTNNSNPKTKINNFTNSALYPNKYFINFYYLGIA
jgi:hypothetical protein